jgi:Icc protein
MRVVAIQPEPFHTITYEAAAQAGRTETLPLPLFLGTVDQLPAGLNGLICLSDLQGIEPRWKRRNAPRLLGELVAEELHLLAILGALPPTATMGVVMAGDLYAAPTADQRGSEGDVRPVWDAFGALFRWVIGVPGNHDRSDDAPRPATRFAPDPPMYYLDGAACTVDSLQIAGIGGIIGNPAKPLRRTEAHYRALITQLALRKPDMLILHESPAMAEYHYRGSASIRTMLDTSVISLVIAGHTQWNAPLGALPNGCQIVNVDSRVIVFQERVDRTKTHSPPE